jgi:Xaa-Pro dipeptidase
MTFQAIERIELSELEQRHARCRALLAQYAPKAKGLLAFSSLSLYHLAGTLGTGAFWLPLEGLAVLLTRRGRERCALESPIEHILSFRSYGDLPKVLAEVGAPLPKKPDAVAVEMNGLSWTLGELLRSRLSEYDFVPGDMALALTRAVKSEWELRKMRLAGQRHRQSMCELLPASIRPGMSEREIAHKMWEAFFSLGHAGLLRMNAFGEEVFMGHISAGDSANYPSRYNGPVGLRGEHPCVPFMGYAGKIWKKGEPLTCDTGFCLEGYQTDKTQAYWAGPRKSIPAEVLAAHEFCVEVQSYAASQLKPGGIPSEIYAKSMDMAAKAGFAEGFMALGANKVAFLGHGIGLAIDEQPVLAKGFDAPLELGMVLAVEPKMGIPGLGMVGAENTFEVTPQGGVCLTGNSFEMICVED